MSKETPKRRRVQRKFTGPSRVDPSHVDHCDINTMMARRMQGVPLPVQTVEGLYGDFTAVGSYFDAVCRVEAAKQSFESLPAQVRERFRNDPGALVAFLADDANREEAGKMGLLRPEEPTPEPEPDPPADGDPPAPEPKPEQ